MHIDLNAVIKNLKAAHAKAEVDFAEANVKPGDHAADFARIIGSLQGTITNALIDLEIEAEIEQLNRTGVTR